MAAFIENEECLAINGEREILKCTLKYNIAEYNDDLFTLYGIDHPHNFSRTVKKRRAEYLAARVAARTAIKKLGLNDNAQVRNAKPPHRHPIWPEGVYGSISHSENLAIVIVSSKKKLIGVDIESFKSLEILKPAINEICPNPIEQKLTQADTALVIAFSGKESLYKALYPEVQRMFGFECADLVDFSDSTFTLRLTVDLTNKLIKGTEFNGNYYISGEMVTTYFLI